MHISFLSPLTLMKNPITFLLLTLTFTSSHFLSAALNYRNLTDVQGRTIQAHVWKVVGNEVFLEFRDGRKFRVSTQVFSPQSQALIQQLAQPPAPAPTPSGNPFGATSPAPTPAPPPVPTATAVPFAISTPSVTPPAPSFPPAGSPTASSGAIIDISSALLPNASILGKVDAAKIQNSPFGQALKSQLKPPAAPGAPSGAGPDMPFGLSEDDIQAVAFSVTNLDKINIAEVKQAGPAAIKNLPAEVQFVLAITLAKPIPYDEAKAEMMKDPNPPVFADYAGALLGTPPPGTKDIPENFCVCLKNQGTGSIFFMGEVKTVKSILDGQSQSAQGGLSNEDLALSFSIPASLMDEIAAGSADNPIMAGLMASLKQMNRITLGMSFAQAANISLAAHFGDQAVAQQLSQMLAPMVASMASKPDTPPFLKQLAITNSGSTLNASLAIQSQDAMGLASMAMMGGAGGGDPEMIPEPAAFPPVGAGAPGTPPPTNGVPFSVESSSSPAAPAPGNGVDPFAN